MSHQIGGIFRDILEVCDGLGLIGKEIFALDGCKLPSNAAKEWSGTRSDFENKRIKIRKAINWLTHHLQETKKDQNQPQMRERELKQLRKLESADKKITDWLASHDDKIGRRAKPIKSNITDNDSAKMKTSHGVIQGYDGLSMVDGRRQVVVYAKAFGDAQEQQLLVPMVDGTKQEFSSIHSSENIFDKAKLVIDAGFHTEANMKKLFDEGVDAYVADSHFRQRDPRFSNADRHKEKKKSGTKKFKPKDFTYSKEQLSCVCPAGKKLYLKNRNFTCKGKMLSAFRQD
jgi:hypothetical protein